MTHDLKSPPFSVLPSLDCKTPQLTLDPHDPDKTNPHKVTKINSPEDIQLLWAGMITATILSLSQESNPVIRSDLTSLVTCPLSLLCSGLSLSANVDDDHHHPHSYQSHTIPL